MCREWTASHLFANLEYEIDELRRDIQVCEFAQQAGTIETIFEHDYVLVPPGKVTTKEGKPYSVFTPFHKNWSAVMSEDLQAYSKDYPLPAANGDAIRKDPVLGQLFQDQVPESIPGYELPSEEYKQKVLLLHPTGTAAAEQVRPSITRINCSLTALADAAALHDYTFPEGSLLGVTSGVWSCGGRKELPCSEVLFRSQ